MTRALQFLARPDVLLDLHVYGGLLVAGWGGWHIHWQWTCVSLGLALVAIGLWGAQRKVHHDPRSPEPESERHLPGARGRDVVPD